MKKTTGIYRLTSLPQPIDPSVNGTYRETSLPFNPCELASRGPLPLGATETILSSVDQTTELKKTTRNLATEIEKPFFAYFLLAWRKSKASGGTQPADLDCELKESNNRKHRGHNEKVSWNLPVKNLSSAD